MKAKQSQDSVSVQDQKSVSDYEAMFDDLFCSFEEDKQSKKAININESKQTDKPANNYDQEPVLPAVQNYKSAEYKPNLTLFKRITGTIEVVQSLKESDENRFKATLEIEKQQLNAQVQESKALIEGKSVQKINRIKTEYHKIFSQQRLEMQKNQHEFIQISSDSYLETVTKIESNELIPKEIKDKLIKSLTKHLNETLKIIDD
jgi:hypothetical protein